MTVASLINLNHYYPASMVDPLTAQPACTASLERVLPPALATMELSDDPIVPIEEPLRRIYDEYRPTPLFEARKFADSLGNGCRVFVKDEGATPSGNHKANSALWIAYHCARDGVETITTETTGNWGYALAQAGHRFGLQVVCFIDEQSMRARPDRGRLMADAGAVVRVVGSDDQRYDPLVLSATRAIEYTQQQQSAFYIFGSVYNYFILPQTMVGLEAHAQLEGITPDVVVGSCGGGANFLGIATAFITDAKFDRPAVELVCAESELCPIVSAGIWGEHSIDNAGYYPLMSTYALPRLLGDEYIGGLGSTIVASPVAQLHQRGAVRTSTIDRTQARSAARLFEATEHRTVALETSYQLAAVVLEVKRAADRTVLVNISSRGARSSFA